MGVCDSKDGLCESCRVKLHLDKADDSDDTMDKISQFCKLCHLISLMVQFIKLSRPIQPLRSYKFRIIRLVSEQDLASLDETQSLQAWPIKDLSRNLIIEEDYTNTTTKIPTRDGEDLFSQNLENYKSVTTAWPKRSIDLYYRLPKVSVHCSKLRIEYPKIPSEDSQDSRAVRHLLPAGHSSILPANWESTIERTKRLLQSCRQDHTHCQNNFATRVYFTNFSGTFPYRVRFVHCIPSGTSLKVRLVQYSSQAPPYITLSHRWNKQNIYKLTSKNFDDSIKEISLDNLPATFRDAVVFGASLGIFHIWIDSLCIIQDDEDDWRQQSSQMGLVFAKSFCTLAAIDAFSDSTVDMGLMVPRDAVPAKISIKAAFQVQYDSSQVDQSGDERHFLRGEAVDTHSLSDIAWGKRDFDIDFQYTSFDTSIKNSAWTTRGWILQERLLSTRIIYFTKERIFWECAEGIANETSMHEKIQIMETNEPLSDSNLHRMLQQHRITSPVLPQRKEKNWGNLTFFDTWQDYSTLREWWPITERYSRCSLTFTKDRWLAIEGLCSVLQHKYQSTIHAGMWRTAIGGCLLWHAVSHPISSFSDFTAPSWSWLAFNAPITYAYQDESYTGYIQDVAPLIQNFEFFNLVAIPAESNNLDQTCLRYGFFGGMKLSCPISHVTISLLQFRDFHFRETTGQATDSPAWKFFRDISAGRSQFELAREYRTVDLPPTTHLLMAPHGTSEKKPEEEKNRAIGWVVLDQDERPEGVVLCAAVVMRILHGRKDSEQHIIECIVLVETSTRDERDFGIGGAQYRRIGRGRIVEKDWLNICETKTVCCV